MISARLVREAALQVLYGLDAHGVEHSPDPALLESLRASVRAENDQITDQQLRKAERLALDALERRHEADALFEKLSPAWPVSRQPAVDRAILRLAYAELALGKTPGKVVISEAVELARRFSTQKSPAFVNALLDAAWRTLGGASVPPVEPNTC